MLGRSSFLLIILSLTAIINTVFSLTQWWENSKVNTFLNQVLELTSDNFDQFVGKQKYLVVKFYTKWCYYCKQMAPEFEKLYDHYKETAKRDDLEIARIEASENDDISLRYGIFSFPRVILFGPGDPRIRSVFDNRPRNLKYFTQWIDKEAPVNQVKEGDKQSVENQNQEASANASSKNEAETKHEVVNAIQHPNNDSNGEKLTSEIEFVKRDMITMKSRIDALEETIKQLRVDLNNTITDNTKTKVYSPPTFSYVLILFVLVIIIAAALTVKRIFIKPNTSGVDHHMKV